jgi:hypothetical protein
MALVTRKAYGFRFKSTLPMKPKHRRSGIIMTKRESKRAVYQGRECYTVLGALSRAEAQYGTLILRPVVIVRFGGDGCE